MTGDLAAATHVTDEVAELAEVIEGAIERAGRRGMSPARAARAVRCTTAEARDAIAFLLAHQHAHTTRHGGSWSHIQAGRAA